jgi:two-component sensor histidine kinase
LSSYYQTDFRFELIDSQTGLLYKRSKEFSKDSRILRTKRNSLLLIRNDGTIVAKNINKYGETRIIVTDNKIEIPYSPNENISQSEREKYYETLRETLIKDKANKFQWTFLPEEIISLIKNDLEYQKKGGFNFSILFIILGTIFVSGGMAFIIYKARVKAFRKKEANKRLISELELKAIRAQMNPHFVFNALSSIQHLINQDKNIEANRYLLNFANLLRMTLATSEKKLISLSDETTQLELYLRLEQLRVPFDYRIEIDNAIQPDNEEIPGMLLQPIVENAVKHGVGSVREGTKGMVTIRFNKSENHLHIEISDNGAGFPSTIVSASGFDTGADSPATALIETAKGFHKGADSPATTLIETASSFGLKATEERLRLIRYEFKTNIGIRFENNYPTGAKVVISIPV